MKELSDETAEHAELVACMREYQAGSLDAFERLHARLAGDLGRFFGTTSRDRAVAEDLVQETFLELHRARRTYLPPLPVRPWVFGIARNVERRHRRDAWRRSRLFRDGSSHREPVAAPRTLEASDLHAALERLPAGKRAAWQLHHVDGLSFAEIAERLGIGSAAAKLRSSRAARSLRAFLAGGETPDE